VPAAPSLYRRHRPRTFADVVGQEHVVRTLRNAIEQGKVHHAYLFVGSRGTGKTSMAKILAASLNCQGEAAGGQGPGGPTIEPCGACASCLAIAGATSLDVIEMDAASNNSVDDIRDLREKVAFAPVSGRHKVYILDEAHMLTTAAWNAFLKTLEEPPPHTVFVLATTEAAKVLPTVVDRCHRFDFARPTLGQIASVLERVARAESIDIGDEARALIARSATGSFRDALGTLEQLLAFADGAAIGLDDVLAVLGAVDADLVFGAVDALAAGDPRAALQLVARVADTGRDLERFFRDLEGHARALMVVQVLGEVPAELKLTDEQDARLAEQAQRVGPTDVTRLLDLIAAALRAMKDGADARTQLELALLKGAAPQHDSQTRALLARIERLERALAPGPAPAPHAPDVPATAAGRAARQAAGAGAAKEPSGASGAAEPPSDAPPPAANGAVAAVAPPEAPLDLEAFAGLWPGVVEAVREEHPLVASVLLEARPAALERDILTLAWPESSGFLKRKAEEAANRELLTRTLRTLTGRPLRIAYELRAPHDLEAAPAAAAGPEVLSEDELIDRFKREFGAEELPSEPQETR
jgi:DNA polymerase-3 subunit gamma/tau